MTHRRDPLHPLDALNQSCKDFPGGIEVLALRRGVSAPTLYKKLEHRNSTHNLGYADELSDLLFELQAAGVPGWDATLHALCHRHGGVYVRLPELPADASGQATMLTEQILRIVKEQGDVAAVLSEALSNDGEIDDKEIKRFEEQHSEAIAALVALGEMVRSRHAATRKVRVAVAA